MESHVEETLRDMGSQVELVNGQPQFNALGHIAGRVAHKVMSMAFREPERLAEKRLLETVSRFQPTLILVILGSQLSPKTVELMRQRTKAPIVCWCQDQMTTLGRQYLLGAGYDAVFVKDRYMQDLFSRMIRSTQFHYLPEACNPRVHRPVSLTDDDRVHFGCDVMIAGSLYYYRQEILLQLREFDVKVWGGTFDWMVRRLPGMYMGREVVLDDKARAARAATISLNTLHYAEINGLNCRAFELAGCGAFQLISAKPVVAEHFEIGKEIETFATVDELVDKVRHYLAHPELAEHIANRAQERARHEHTYAHRLRRIFEVSLGAPMT